MKINFQLLHYIGLLIAFSPLLISMFFIKQQLDWKIAVPLIIFGGTLMLIAKIKKKEG
ncbi:MULTISPECIES: hypothetical protein [Bacillus]|uniref:hypothetical protein n=1 Tax=Bacillus TaxID=1386 RepID=UPI000AAF5E0A|nr:MULTISPECIES: hypothetical protein [Bacillus]MBL3854050.1 hypothetical protein [Bacillus cereus]MDA2046410.1 hypothetical protein [Bacillus cereus]MDA2738880.1 hypothetical protein [Bacillus cereus group sp. Bc015]MDG1601120.1 hypothetical protein [Bacillus cereus]MEC3859492.1 hypothetical protein [Bacillus sp. WOD8 KX774193]